MSRIALLVVSFGTTYKQTRQKTIAATEQAFQRAFPEADVFRAFTSKIVISRIQQHEGVVVATPAQALEKIQAAGYDTLYVQSLHLIPGIEYHQLLQQVRKVTPAFKQVVIGKPLLETFEDYQQVVTFLEQLHQPLDKNAAVLFMGHGTAHHAFTAYACLDHMLRGTRHYVGAVESYPDIDLELTRLKANGITKVTLQPLMLVAGNHAHQDMASTQPESWRSKLEAAGIKVASDLTGMGEYPEIQNLFIAHLKQQLNQQGTVTA